MNREALARLGPRDKKLVIVPGATHLFEEPGTLKEVARTAAEWSPGISNLMRGALPKERQEAEAWP